MKKTLIAASIAALAAGSANAAVTLHESETGSFATYGKLQLELQNQDGENNIQNQGSRFGFSGTQVLDNGMEAFANYEFRFNPGARNDSDTANTLDLDHMEVRNSFIGVKGNFGSVKAGNFDSVVYSNVTGAADIMENSGWRSLDGSGNNAQATSIAYETADLGGLKLAVGIKHYASNKSAYAGVGAPLESKTGDEAWNLQVAGTFALSEELSLAFGFDQNNEDGNAAGNGKDPIMAFGATYAADAFGAGAVVESNDETLVLNVTGSFNYGAGDVYGIVSFVDDGAETGIDLGVGANYSLAENFYVYGEFAQGNDKNTTQVASLGDMSIITLGASYGW